MFRHIKLIRQLRGKCSASRILIMFLIFITTVAVMSTFTMTFIVRKRHEAWRGSGIENAAFFSINFRFSGWPGEGYESPPAYNKLISALNAMPNARACAVDYKRAFMNDDMNAVTLRIYPQNLYESISTPLSSGKFCYSSDFAESVPVVLDNRLQSVYTIGSQFELRVSQYSNAQNVDGEIEWRLPAIVTGFLNSDNDCLSTHSASNAGSISTFASKSTDNDQYVILMTEHPLMAQSRFTGGHGSVILLPKDGGDVNQQVDAWRDGIAGLNLGRIDTYADIIYNDTLGIAVIQNMDLFLLCVWLMILTCTGLIGHCLMQTNLWMRRTAVYELIGMGKLKLTAYVAMAGYFPLWLSNILGLVVGNYIIGTMYEGLPLDSIRISLLIFTLAITALPHIVALITDCSRLIKSDPIRIWNTRR